MTRGVPRLKELLKATRNPKAIELTIPLRRDLRDKKEEARRVAQELEFTLLSDIVTVARIYYDPRDTATLIAEDADWLAYLAAYEHAIPEVAPVTQTDPLTGDDGSTTDEAPARSPWVLRVELDRAMMFTKNITMDDIALILRTKFGQYISTLYTDYNASRLVFRIRIDRQEVPMSAIDDLQVLKTIQNKILSGTAVRGITGLRTVNYQKVNDTVELQDGKYKPVEEYVLISDGSNFLDVLTHPDVDATRVVSSNVHDMFENLGIEATRATFYKEITTLFAESGSSVNYRHVCILLDKICSKGRTMSIDRYGINKNDIGPLAKMSFEQTEDIALRAAVFGERDPVLGISAKVMLGAPIKAGTSFSEILFDEVDAIHLSETTPEQRKPVTSGPQRFTGEELDDALYDTEVEGECSATNLRIPVSLPASTALETVEEMEDVDIAVYE
jgi:DNA-directed RNA polymerase II subunit RPB1